MSPRGTTGKGPFAREEQYASILVGDHAIDDGAGAIEGSIEDDTAHALPVFQGHLREGLMGTNRSIVDEDVDAAKFRQGARHHTIDLLFLGDIGEQRQGLATAGTDLLGDRVSLSFVSAGVDDDVGSFCGQL
jgi:hypothetical protein